MKNWLTFGFVLILLLGVAAAQGAAPLKLSARIPLANVNGRMDHLAVDIDGQRIFAAAFDNHTLEVVDLRAGKQIATISNLDEPQQPVYDPSTNHLFVSSSGDGTVKMFDGRTFQLLHTEQLSADADDVRYDPRRKHVLVGYGGEKFIYGKAARKRAPGRSRSSMVHRESSSPKSRRTMPMLSPSSSRHGDPHLHQFAGQQGDRGRRSRQQHHSGALAGDGMLRQFSDATG